jgi:hypothetical protein
MTQHNPASNPASGQTDTEFMGIVENLVDFKFEEASHAADWVVIDRIPADVDEETLELMLEFLAPAREALVDDMVLKHLK